MGLTNEAIVGMTNAVPEGMMALVERASKKYHEWGDTDSGRTIIAEWALRDWIGERKWYRWPIESAGQVVKVMHRIASTARRNPGQSMRAKATVTHAVTPKPPVLFL
jgi:hypothetical protein